MVATTFFAYLGAEFANTNFKDRRTSESIINIPENRIKDKRLFLKKVVAFNSDIW